MTLRVKRGWPGCLLIFVSSQYAEQVCGVQVEEVQEWHRRDGFEAGNADKIFDSTRLALRS